ncbi:M14 family zinc carboxypeptidase [Sorangium sp. So ce590]|uniref:M14 family zinc carboxypeptidase n=1 Tax=Sorangium sp. So ce590 TaxID=3133317 RepID=UPI003F631C0E
MSRYVARTLRSDDFSTLMELEAALFGSALHPFAGSRLRWSPHDTGPHAFSEPESRALRDVALETRPALALGFHSCGNLLLYPWAHTGAPNPRAPLYRALGDAFCRGLPRAAARAVRGPAGGALVPHGRRHG